MNLIKSKKDLNILISTIIVVLFLLLAMSPVINSSELDDQKDVHLLRGEHYLYINATQDVFNITVWFAFPPDYGYQVPIYLEIYNDTTADIKSYQIENDSDGLNKLINFTISHIYEGGSVLIHFSCWVLIKNHDFSDLPIEVKFPRRKNLPEYTKKWLVRTEVVQKWSILIRHKSRQLNRLNNDVIKYAESVASFIKKHRFILFLIQLRLGVFFSQDAKTTLFINGENVGRSHLACALFRCKNIPARVLLAHNDQGFWTQMHYMVEYYLPGYGWILLDSTAGKTPYETKKQIINRICFPEDEQETKTDYIFPRMKGEERWMWFDSEFVYPYYVDCRSGSKSQMFSESEVTAESYIADYAFLLTQIVYHQYEKYLGRNLSFENKVLFENATENQYKAMGQLIDTEDLYEYIYYMDIAFDYYKEIIL